MKKKIFILFTIILILVSPIGAKAENLIEGEAYKNFSSLRQDLRSYLLIDFETEEILEEYNIYEPVEIASISKLMTYLIIMDAVGQDKISLDDTIPIDKDTARVGGSSFKLKAGEEFTVRELLEAALVVSGNDAAYALAKYLGETEADFVKLMNEKALELGLVNTKFYNSTGLPVNTEVQNIMTTREIFILSKHIIENYPQTLEITRQKVLSYEERDFFQLNTNPLLFDIREVDGLKTGFTNKAGNCYVSTFKTPGIGNKTKDLRLVAIVMGAKSYEERNILSKILVEHGLYNYSNKIFLDKKMPIDRIELDKSDIINVELYPEEDFSKLIKLNKDYGLDIDLDEILLPLEKGDIVGRVTVNEEGRPIFSTRLLVRQDVNRAKWYVIIWRFIKKLLKID